MQNVFSEIGQKQKKKKQKKKKKKKKDQAQFAFAPHILRIAQFHQDHCCHWQILKYFSGSS